MIDDCRMGGEDNLLWFELIDLGVIENSQSKCMISLELDLKYGV